MEIAPDLIRHPVEFGVCAVAHLGILAHRVFRRLNHNLPRQYHQTSNDIEHVISHATRPLFFSSIIGLDLSYISNITTAVWLGAVTGLVVDGLLPSIRERSPQYRQLTMNSIGQGLFFISTYLLQLK